MDTEAPTRHLPAVEPPRRTAALSACRVRDVSTERERTRHVHDRGHSRDGRGQPPRKYRNKEAQARNLLLGSPNSSYAESSARRVEAFDSSRHRYDSRDRRSRREHDGAGDSSRHDRASRGYRRGGGAAVESDGEPYLSYGCRRVDGSPGRPVIQPPQSPASGDNRRAGVTFRHGQALEFYFPTAFQRELRPPSRPAGAPILKQVPPLQRPVDTAIEWQRIRDFLLANVSKQNTDDKMDTLATYGKTVPAMIYEMERVYEQLTAAVVDPAPDAAPRHGLSIQQLEAYAAKAGVSKWIIDTGANASMCAEGTPFGDTKPAVAMITGATAAAPIAAAEVGSLTVISISDDGHGPVHLSSEKLHVLSTLPPGLILFSFAELVLNGWRFVQKTNGEMFLQSSPTADHNRRKLRLSMDGGVLSIANVSAVVPGILPQPSGLDGTSVYHVGLEASELQQEVVTDPHPVFNSCVVYTAGHDALMRVLPEDEEALMSSRKHQHRRWPAIQRSRLSANGRSAAGSDPLEKNQARRAAKKAEREKKRAESEQDLAGLPEQYDRAAGLAVDPPVDAPEAAPAPSQPMLAAKRAAKNANHMQTCDVNQVPVRSVTSSADAIEAQVLRNAISPTAIASRGTYPECMV